MFSAKSQNRSFKYLNINKTHKKSLIFAAFLLSVISFSTLNEAYTEDAYTKGQATGANEIYALFGQAAQYLLIYLLFIKPLGIVFNITVFKMQLSYRRQMGVATFWLALFHVVTLIVDRQIYTLAEFTGMDNFLLYGFVAIVGMTILAITSNNISQKFLGKYWKKIQYLSYPTLYFTLLHVALLEQELLMFFAISTAFIVLKFLEFKKVRFR